MHRTQVNTLSNTASFYQFLFNILGYLGVSNTFLRFDIKRSEYIIIPTTIPCLILHVINKLNYIAKLLYLILLLSGVFKDINFEFLDYVSVGFWLLVMGLIFISEGFWFRKYPFFEIVCAGWKIQNEIHSKLRERDVFLKKLQTSIFKKATFQIFVLLVGISSIVVQYSASPKYPVFTGYLVEEDSTRMTILFGFHDVGFLVTAWFFYGAVICLSSLFGGQISLTIEYMTDELQIFVDNIKDHDGRLNGEYHFERQQQHSSSRSRRLRNQLNAAEGKLEELHYSLDTLIFDYRKLMMYMELLNEFCSYKFLFIHIAAYIQMIADVFLMIQILRSGGQFTDVFFYLEDCGVCMFMLFKCFKSMSLVQAASENFLQTYKTLLSGAVKNRNYYRNTFLTLKTIALKIGPHFVGPMTVGNAMMVLLNYYIAAALW